MGQPATPTPSDRAAIRDLSRAIIAAVENDERWPAPFWNKLTDAEKTAILEMAQEIRKLQDERDRAMHIVEAVARAEDDDLVGHIKIYPNDGNDTFPDGERAKYLVHYADELMGKAVTVCRKEKP